MRQILHLQVDLVGREGMVELDLIQRGHVDVVLREDARHLGQGSGPVVQRHAQPPHRTDRLARPGQVDPV